MSSAPSMCGPNTARRSSSIRARANSGRYKPEIDFLVLDGIPRNVNQAKLLKSKIDVRRVFHLTCSDKAKIYDRLKRRALKDNRLDDINEQVIERRLRVYEEETKPVLDYYGPKLITHVNADQWPYQVLRDILVDIEHYRTAPID
jgi:adenylate kinase